MLPLDVNKKNSLIAAGLTLVFCLLLLGCCFWMGLYRQNPPPPEEGVDVNVGDSDFGSGNSMEAVLYIFVDPGQKGKGIGFRSVRLMCDYAFDTMGLNKIILYANGDNAAARHLYEKIGFVLESVVEGGIENHGVAKDQYYYGLTRN